MDLNQTSRTISQITDEGVFEQLAMAVLRAAAPELYANLTHPGINPHGKTIKGPIDGISFVAGANPPHMVAVHHTTSKRKDLRRKWLHNTSKTKSRPAKQTVPPGDLTKTIEIVGKERVRTPDLCVTIALTINQEPPEDLTRDIDATARANNVTLDIWSLSRIVNYLDNNPDGQWLRKKYLGIEQERLSLDLLHELSRRSVEAYQPLSRDSEWIDRNTARRLIEGLPKPIGFVVGESGFGKSVACYQYLIHHINGGGCGLVLGHELLAPSITIDQAIDSVLRQFHPTLAVGSGAEARSLCSTDVPLLIIIEDISRSGQTPHLIDKLVHWAISHNAKDPRGGSTWRIICPVWPELLGALRDETRNRVAALTAQLGSFTVPEAREAILKRASLERIDVSILDADVIAETLGYDPLLIALHDLKDSPSSQNVIATFITRSTERLAITNGTRTASEYARALQSLATAMLQRRKVDPTWSDVLSWFQDSADQIGALRELAKHGAVIRVPSPQEDARLAFRHDRLYKWLLTQAATQALKGQGLDEAIFSEPFFSDVVGVALADPSIKPSVAERARLSNPLSLFHALHSFREPSSEGHNAVLAAMDRWLSTEASHRRVHQSLRYAALHILSDTQSSHVIRMVERFRDRSWGGPLAGLRNGDLKAGLKLCYSLEPGSGAEWRDRAIEHAKARFGPSLISELKAFLCRPGLTSAEVVGGLRLAGHIADTSLSEAIEACWLSDTGRTTHLEDYLWAAAQCGGDHTEQLLRPMCDEWAALPDQTEDSGLPSRNSLAAHELAWAFAKTLPTTALAYFIRRAAHNDLRWPITYMLRRVDHPDAVEFLANELAIRSRTGKNSIQSLALTIRQEWQRWQQQSSAAMSDRSRARLQSLWRDNNHDRDLREQAFRLWDSTPHPDDLRVLQGVGSSDLIADDILRARIERGDRTAIPSFIEKIKNDERGYWWQFGIKLWSDDLTHALDDRLRQRGSNVTPTWGDSYNDDWITSCLLARREPAVAEDLLCKHWHHLRFSPYHVQVALYAASPRLRELVEETIRECPSPKAMFLHIDSRFGIKQLGHPGVTRIDQVEGILPYLDYIDESSIYHFWEVCNERGWTELRRAHLDARLGEWREHAGVDDETLLTQLDQDLQHQHAPWMDLWIQRSLDSGRTIDNILEIVRRWLMSNKGERALEIAASIIIHVGSRADVNFLTEGSDHSELAKEIISDAHFAVAHRTLL